jgi:hypothetical protein
MKQFRKFLAVAALAASAGAQAVTLPTPSQPISTFPSFGDSPSLLLAIFDEATSRSIVYNLGLLRDPSGSFTGFRLSDLTTTGPDEIRMEFTLPGVDIFAGTNARFSVFAADTARGSRGGGNIYTTYVPNPEAAATYTQIVAATDNIQNFFANVVTAGGCGIPCISNPAAGAAAPNYFTPQDGFAALPVGSATSAPIFAGPSGNAIAFYLLGNNSTNTQNRNEAIAYTNGTGDGRVGTFSYASGVLTYLFPGASAPPIPLPAAVWMLLSGLAGLGVVARRRPAQAVAA